MAARALICRTLLVVSAFVGSGCYRSNVSTKIYSKDRSERRVLTQEEAPLLQRAWHVEGQLDTFHVEHASAGAAPAPSSEHAPPSFAAP